jgi:hypothetical protein
VMVERIILRQHGRRLEIPLEAIPTDDGFYPPEQNGQRRWRWTDGNARLMIPNGFAQDGPVVVDLHVAAAQASWVRAQTTKSRNGTTLSARLSANAA